MAVGPIEVNQRFAVFLRATHQWIFPAIPRPKPLSYAICPIGPMGADRTQSRVITIAYQATVRCFFCMAGFASKSAQLPENTI